MKNEKFIHANMELAEQGLTDLTNVNASLCE